jgi:hypothetical protein
LKNVTSVPAIVNIDVNAFSMVMRSF